MTIHSVSFDDGTILSVGDRFKYILLTSSTDGVVGRFTRSKGELCIVTKEGFIVSPDSFVCKLTSVQRKKKKP